MTQMRSIFNAELNVNTLHLVINMLEILEFFIIKKYINKK